MGKNGSSQTRKRQLLVSRKEFEQDVQSHFPEKNQNGLKPRLGFGNIVNEVDKCVCKAPLGAQVRWWNIWADTATK
jgi:hypothetical protein